MKRAKLGAEANLPNMERAREERGIPIMEAINTSHNLHSARKID